MTTMRVVGKCFFWYRLTRIFPDKFHRAVKRLCCVCVVVLICLNMQHIATYQICAFSALTLLVVHQEEYLACKKLNDEVLVWLFI